MNGSDIRRSFPDRGKVARSSIPLPFLPCAKLPFPRQWTGRECNECSLDPSLKHIPECNRTLQSPQHQAESTTQRHHLQVLETTFCLRIPANMAPTPDTSCHTSHDISMPWEEVLKKLLESAVVIMEMMPQLTKPGGYKQVCFRDRSIHTYTHTYSEVVRERSSPLYTPTPLSLRQHFLPACDTLLILRPTEHSRTYSKSYSKSPTKYPPQLHLEPSYQSPYPIVYTTTPSSSPKSAIYSTYLHTYHTKRRKKGRKKETL